MASESKRDQVGVSQQEEPKKEPSGAGSQDNSMAREDTTRLLHQLHVHQVQLEMQNEELRQAQETLAEACEHYTQLYDLSPAGYVTLSPEGISHGLHPEQTATLTLNDALRACVASFTEQTSINGTFYAPLQPVPLLPAISTCLYRVAQEGLTNIRLHAKAKRANVTLNGLPDAIELLIKDDGQGFVPEAVSGSHHLGLTSMRERVEQLNGTMVINSRPEWGTTIVIQIPLFQADQAGPPTI